MDIANVLFLTAFKKKEEKKRFAAFGIPATCRYQWVEQTLRHDELLVNV